MHIANFLPHQDPMIFLQELIDAGEDYAIAKLTVSKALMFANEHGLPTWSSIELMAQTISLYSGVRWHQKGQSPRIGFLLGTKKMTFPIDYFKLGSEIIISVKKKSRHNSVWLFDCELHYEDLHWNAVLNVYEPID